MLGISVYFQDFDIDYIKEAVKHGVTDVFTSLGIPEDNKENFEEKLFALNDICAKNGINLVVDVSTSMFAQLKREQGDFDYIKSLGLKKLRLDFGFDDVDTIKMLQEDFKIVLNASTLSKEFLNSAKASGIDFSNIEAMHNFYPKTNTAISKQSLIEQNELFEKFGIRASAFVPGDRLNRFPAYNGLPTLEKHRGSNPLVAAMELVVDCGVSGILVGDSQAEFSTIDKIRKYIEDNTVVLPAKLYFEDMYGREFPPRPDMPRDLIRIYYSRFESPIEPAKIIKPFKGMISQDNRLSGRYNGEICIAKRDLPFTNISNYIGFVYPEYADALEFIKGEEKIVFVKE